MYHSLNKFCSVFMCVLLTNMLHAQTQNTTITHIELSYSDALNIMLKENLPLIAAHYDISASEGDLLQARTWTNPHFNWNQDLYSIERNEYFNQNNQRLIQIDQMFSIAGKHTRTVKLAKINVELNKLMYEDVKRSLIYELGIIFYQLHSLQQREELYNIVFNQFKTLIDAYEIQFKVGAIPGNELIRLKSELLAIQTTIIANQNEANELMGQLRTILNLKPGVTIKTTDLNARIPDASEIIFSELLSKAEQLRPDYLLSRKQIDYNAMNVKLQKSMAVPDVMIAYQPHDKGSNYVRPYSGLVLEFDLPVFNRNKGNILAATANLERSRTEEEYAQISLQNELSSAIYKMLNTRKALENYSEEFLKKLKTVNDNALENFNNKNISMLEYIDIQRIYIQTMHEYIDLKSESMQNINEVNFTVGTEIY